MVNHLQMNHYHLALICSWCLKYFTSANAMHLHLQLCKPTLAGIYDNDQEESNSDDNGKEEWHIQLGLAPAANWDVVNALPHFMTIQYFLSFVGHLTCLK